MTANQGLSTTKVERSEEEEWERLLKMALDTMQRFNSVKSDRTGCKLCNGRGAVMTVVNDRNKPYPYTAVIPCGCLYNHAQEARMANSGMQERVKQQNFDTYQANEEWQTGVKEVAESYATFDTDKWFYICGKSGSGKTHLCTAVANKFLTKQHTVLYMLWRDVVGQLKRLSTSPEYDEIINKYKKVEILYIDDFLKTINKAKPTDADMQIAFEIINYRDVNNLKTIISSEFNLEEVMSFDEATGSRVLKKADDYYIKLSNDKNYRLS